MKIKQENLNIFYGYGCNYACEGCFSGSNVVNDKKLDPSLEEILQSIPILAENFEVNSMITLIGGEPFLYWDDRILVISQALNKWFPGKKINIFTNGQLLNKHFDKVLHLADHVVDNLSITVTNHLSECGDELPVTLWNKNIQQLLTHPRLVKIHNEHYHIKDNINANIYFSIMTEFKPYYKKNVDGSIKPFATNDPKGSMTHGCPGNVCSTAFGTKFYKCPTLATLPNHLKSINQHHDPDWQKYLSYSAIDLLNIDQELLTAFSNTYGKPISECDMCNNNPANTITKRSYNMIFKPRLHPTFND